MTWSPALHCGARLPAFGSLDWGEAFFPFWSCSACALGSSLRVVSSPLGCAFVSSGQARSFMVVEAASFSSLTFVTALVAPPYLCSSQCGSLCMYHRLVPGTADVLLSVMCFRGRHVHLLEAVGFPRSSA